MDHYTFYNSFAEALVGFAQETRNIGLEAGIQSTKDAIATTLEGIWLDRDIFQYALAAIYCSDQDDRILFDRVYNRFWRQKGSLVQDASSYKNKKSIQKKGNNTAVMNSVGKSDKLQNAAESKTTSGASAQETLKRTDFSKLNQTQEELLDELADKLIREMSLRLKRRKKKSNKGTINMGKSIRKNIQNGGNMVELIRSFPKKEKYRLLILLDISGSMDKYSFYLLKFLWSLKNHFKHIEAFAFSTILMRITDYLKERDIAETLQMVSQHAKHWSGGTKIGLSLQAFNDQYAKRYLNGNTLTLILSDGLCTGEPEVLDEAMRKIKLKSKKLVWLNPLKGMEGYEPLQMGMKTALPSLNHFGSAHNFDSLLELENILIHA